MTAPRRHSLWKFRRPHGNTEIAEGYEEARIAYELAEWARNRRIELGLTQAVVAERAGMNQPQLSKLEAGGIVPTIPILIRLAAALDADLDVGFKPRRADVA